MLCLFQAIIMAKDGKHRKHQQFTMTSTHAESGNPGAFASAAVESPPRTDLAHDPLKAVVARRGVVMPRFMVRAIPPPHTNTNTAHDATSFALGLLP